MLIKELSPGTVYKLKDEHFIQNKLMVIAVPYDIEIVDKEYGAPVCSGLASIDLVSFELVQWQGHEEQEATLLTEGDE